MKGNDKKAKTTLRCREGELVLRSKGRCVPFDPDTVVLLTRGGGEVVLGEYLRAPQRGTPEQFYSLRHGLPDEEVIDPADYEVCVEDDYGEPIWVPADELTSSGRRHSTTGRHTRGGRR